MTKKKPIVPEEVKFKPLNRVEHVHRSWRALAAILAGVLMGTCYALVQTRSRVMRALELLSADSDDLVRPARLEKILSGDRYVPVSLPQATERVVSDPDTVQTPDGRILEHGGVPSRK